MLPHSKKTKGFKYILCVIHCFMKFAWAIALKSKTAKEVSNAMSKILLKRTPKLLQIDNERFNRTLKEKMFREFIARGSYNWIFILPSLINEYNNTKHRTIGMTPTQADLDPALDSQELKTIGGILDNSEANINSEDNIDNNEGNSNIDKSESNSNLKNMNAQPSIFSSSYKKPSLPTSVPTPKRKKIAKKTSLVNKIRKIKLKQLSSTQCIIARDQINSILSRCRLQDLNYGNTTFSFQTSLQLFRLHHDIKQCTNMATSQTDGSILSTTEYQDNFNQEN
ncbi:putative transposon-derived protein F54H12.3, partial [Aphis craccivora]